MISEPRMRRAVRRRDPSYDGRFVYGVVTTGVYCRPSCAARPARPENLRFFDGGAAAVRAGFRPCRRCRPDELAGRYEAMVRLARYIEAHSDEPLTLAQLSAQAALSPSQLVRSFKAAFGVSPRAYRDAIRLGTFKGALRSGGDVSAAIYGAGFGSTSRVYGERLRHLGMTPSAYRSGGAGEMISHACRQTVYGALMMAATDRGVCFVQFGEDANALLGRLRAEFPKATLEPSAAEGSPALDDWIGALAAHLDKGAPRPELPLDLRGTAFQIKVWRFLQSIAEGDVLSYGELAHGIGRPGAARAAGAACAANRVAVLVPCHRVLRGDGALGGYRWGTARKRALLEAERARTRGEPGANS